MIYVISDMHGCYDEFKEMLKKIKFSESDTLYVLGDCADRGRHGVDIWFDLVKRDNVVPIMGNHDDMALKFMRVWRNPELMTDDFQDDLDLWIYNGGRQTLEAFRDQNDETQEKILKFVQSFSLFKEIEVNGQKFFLSHTIGEKPGKKLNEYTREDYIWGRADYSKCYDPDTILITGHTPTGVIDRKYLGLIYKKNNHIAIDCGAVFDAGRLGCICLNNMEEFYVSKKGH